MKNILTAVIAATLIPAAASAAVLNGSFEEDIATAGANNGATFADMPTSGPSWDIWASPDVPGWTTLGLPMGVEIQTENTVGLTPYDGLYYAELDTNANSTIWQDVFLSEGKYELSFAYSPRVNDGGAFTNAVDVTLDGLIVTETVNGPGIDGTAVGEWTVFTYAFEVATNGEYMLTFDAAGSSNSLGGFIDAIEINQVPLPAGGLLLLGGLAGLAGMRRRKKS